MDRKYRTAHQGIAAYLVTQGIEILRYIPGVNPKTNRPNVNIEFDIEQTEGRRMGDAFFEGNVHGDLKQFYDALQTVRQKVYDSKR